ncbi:MAG TPA: DNA alkylation repair protein [Chryseolinea sp.]|nr:DNA alkylation repair protein [Chryseolinea sp.]
MKEDHHRFILDQIQKRAGKPTQHTFLDSYLGNDHPRYAINNMAMRTIAREFMRAHAQLSSEEFSQLLTSLLHGESGTEKMMAGFLLDYSRLDQRKFKPKLFDDWLNELKGWAEIDTLCTGKYARSEIPAQWQAWEPLLKKFSKSKNIGKRRASLVFLCAPTRYTQATELADTAFENILRVSGEREVLITKAISWLLRSMIKLYRKEVMSFVKEHAASLPAIAVRETRTKLSTGVKGKRNTI